MRRLAIRAAGVILHPEMEWPVIARERRLWTVCLNYLAPLALISPLAYGCRALLGGDGALHTFADTDAALRFALLSACGCLLASLLFVLAMSVAIYLLAPLFAGRRSFGDAFRLVAYAGTPVWLSGMVLIAPLNRFPLLVIIILIAVMHSLFLFYLGVHHVLGIPRRDSAECSAIVIFAGIMPSSVAGYYASSFGLFPYM